MLTPQEMQATARELQENERRLGYGRERLAEAVGLTIAEVERVLTMDSPDPGQVWIVRDYLVDMLEQEGREVLPFSKLSDPSVNRWYVYPRPWREK